MLKTPVRRVEDVECSVLNEDVIRTYQGVMKGMGGNPADVKSPGLKVQILISSRGNPNAVCCEKLHYEQGRCAINNGPCYLLERARHFSFE